MTCLSLPCVSMSDMFTQCADTSEIAKGELCIFAKLLANTKMTDIRIKKTRHVNNCVCFFSNNMHENMSTTINHLKMTVFLLTATILHANTTNDD